MTTKINILNLIDFEKVNNLLEGFNKTTGFVTAILDLDGNVLSKSGWRQICTQFHRVNPGTAKNCTTSDTVLANELGNGEKYHFYKCLNGLVDVAVPIIIKGEHIANLFSGQFFFEEPDISFFKKQAKKYDFNEQKYFEALENVPVVSKEKVKIGMDFLLSMTQLISEMTYQKLEQMELNETIRKSEERFRVIFENSLAVMLLIEPETRRIEAANKAAEKFYGWKRSEIETMRVDDINTLTPAEIKVEMDKALKSERIYFRFKHRLANGQIRDVEIYSSKVEIDGKDYLHSIIHDVTEQVNAQGALKQSEAYNRMLFEQSQMGLALADMDGKLVDINSAFAAIIGRKIEETKQLTYWDITPEKYATPEQEQLELLEKTGRYGPYEKEYIHKDGHLVPVRLQGLMIEKEGEKYIWSSVEDISEQKIAEKELRQSEERFKALHNASFGGIAIHDEGIIFDLNRGLSELTGYSKNELAGMNVLNLICPETRDFVNERMLSGYEKPYEAICLHKSGKEFPVQIEARNVPYKGKTVRVAEFRDISEQKLAIEEQAKSLNLLNNLAAQVPGVVYQYRLYPDGSSSFPYSSPGMWDIYEVSPEEVNEDASAVFTRIHPDDYDYIVETITESAKNQTNYESEFRVILPKQGLRWRYCNAKPQLLEDGSTLWHGIITDVTERKLAEEARLKSEEQYRTLFKTMTQGVVYQSANGEIISANPAAEKILGLSIDQMMGRTSIDPRWKAVDEKKNLLPGEKHPAMIALQTGKEVKNFTQGIFNPQKNEYVWILVNSIPQFKENEKKPYRVFSTFLDITKQKIAGEEQSRLLNIIEQSRNEIFVFDEDSLRFEFVNQGALENLEFSLDEMKGMTPLNIKPEFTENQFREMLNPLKNGSKERLVFETLHQRKNGTTYPVEIYLQFQLQKSGEKNVFFAVINDITERKLAEEALRKSEERFKIAQDFSPDGFTILHPLRNKKSEIVDFTWIYENQTIARINRTDPEDVKGKRLLDLFPAHKDTSVFETYIDVANSGKPKILEEVYVGEVVSVPTWLRLVVVPMEEDIAILAQDITERKKAKEALSHSHDLMKYIIEHNQSAVAVHDKNLNYVYVSQRYLDDYGVKEKDVIGKHHYDVFPDIPEKWRKVHQKALRGIVSRADEDKFYREDGTLDWTRWECRPWYEANGSIGGMIVYTEVINEQKRKEEEIKKLNERLEILIDSIQQLSASQTLDTVQDIVAKSARKLIGADGATLVLRDDDNCFYVNEDAIQPLWKGKRFTMKSCISGWVMENKKSVVIEDIFVDERIPQDVYSPTFVKSLAMVPVNISEPIGAIGNYWKETYAPTAIEMQLLQTLADAAARAIENIQLYSELEDRVKRRTQQLHTVNKELETFTYSVSHDLKAPLRGIDGYSKLLLDEYGDSLNEEAAHFIKTIRSSTLQMNLLIEDLLSYSRLERSHFKQEKIALKSFTETLVSNFGEEIKKDRFEVDINIPDVEIFTDSTGLTIILRNFIENAIKFTREKPNPKLEINVSENPENWIIAVKDNGVGFDMKYHDRIFEIFQRLHRAEDFPGTGIGLAMVAKAAQRMGAKTRAESIPGKGSTFFIEIQKNKSI